MSDGIAGPIATLLLAEAGADVVIVEPPEGKTTRSASGFRTWGRSKRSVVLDVDTAEGRATLDQLLAAADVLVHNFGPSRAAELSLDDNSLAHDHPDLIACSLLSWPANHADADLPVEELLAMARLGVLDEQQGHRDGPVFLRFPIGNWSSAYLLAIGIMARLLVRERTGNAGPVHTSLAQGGLVPMAMHWQRAETPSPSLEWGMPKSNTMATLFECADGVWIHHMGRTEQSPLMLEVIEELGNPEMLPAEQTGTLRPGYGRDVYIDAFRRRPSKDWLEDFWAHDVPVQSAVRLGEILQRRAVACERVPARARRSGRGQDHGARPAAHDHAFRSGAERGTRARRAHRRCARRVEAERACACRGDERKRPTMAARGREGARPRQLPGGTVRRHVAR